MIYIPDKEVPSFPLDYALFVASPTKYRTSISQLFVAPTVSCRDGLTELRQPSRAVVQLSQQLFASQKTPQKTLQIKSKSTQTT